MNQETPNFESYKSRYNSFLLPNLVDNPIQPVEQPHKDIIKDAYEKMGVYFTEDAFRHTLSLQRRNNIESNINAALDQFQQIVTFLSSNPPQLNGNILNITNSLQSYLEEIDMRFWTPYQVYLLQDKQNITATIEKIKKGAREVQAARDSSEETLRAAGLLVSLSAEAEVANYFQRSVNGLDVTENDAVLKNRKVMNPNYLFIGMIGSAVLLWLATPRITQLIADFSRTSPAHYIYLMIASLLVTAYPLKVFTSWLQSTRPSGYERSASLWFIGAVLSVLGTGIYAAILLSGFDGSSELNELVPKIVSLLAPAYLVRFCVQNFRANKHVATMNSQKAIAAKSLQAYTRNLSTADEGLKAQNSAIIGEIQKNVATIIFDPGETGFITIKEGAGASDSFFQGTPLDRNQLGR